jgi:tight adherence protein C
MSPLLLVGVLALFLAILVGVGTLVLGGTGRTEVSRGLASIDQVYAAQAGSEPAVSQQQRRGLLAAASRALAGLLVPEATIRSLRRWLDYAGNPAAWPLERVVETQGLGLVVLGICGGLVGLVGKGILGGVVGGLIGGLVGLVLPALLVYNAGLKRQQRIQRDLPDALDLLTLSVEAGMGFDAALSQVAATMPGPLAGEIARVLQEMQMGVRRADAMRGLGTRTRVLQLRTTATAVMQAGELGIPIANVLREQANEMRLVRRQRAEEQARKVPVKVVIPLILCLFPALFIVVIGPAAINLINLMMR